MVDADIPIAPLAGIHLADIPTEVGEVVPVVAIAGDEFWIAPVVVSFAVGRKVDIAHLCLPGILFVVAGIALPEIAVAMCTDEGLFHVRFDAMGEGFEHFSDTALVGEAHDDKTA